jgi:hypothetical protein
VRRLPVLVKHCEVFAGCESSHQTREDPKSQWWKEQDRRKSGGTECDPAEESRHFAPIAARAEVMPPYRRSRF